jgi:hypothetical protein
MRDTSLKPIIWNEHAMTYSSNIDPDTIKAYLETHYRIEGDTPMTLRIGEHNASLAALHETSHVESSAFITAWNPFSQRCDSVTNVRRQEDLAHELTKLGLRFVDGIGLHPTSKWAEPSFLALGLSLDVAKELGLRYEQNAIIWAARDAVPQLVLLR